LSRWGCGRDPVQRVTVAVVGGTAAVASWLLYPDSPAGMAMTAATAAAVLLAASKPKASDVGWVYLIHEPRLNVHKLGWSSDPHARRDRLEAEAHTRLRLIAYGPGSLTYEQALHDRYADRRVATSYPSPTEWFKLSPDEAAEVADELRRRN